MNIPIEIVSNIILYQRPKYEYMTDLLDMFYYIRLIGEDIEYFEDDENYIFMYGLAWWKREIRNYPYF